MRLQTHIWVASYIRTIQSNLLSVYVIKKGEKSAGSIHIKINHLNGKAQIYSPSPYMPDMSGKGEGRLWYEPLGKEIHEEKQVDDYISQQQQWDEDLWYIEVEDPKGRHFLGDQLVQL